MGGPVTFSGCRQKELDRNSPCMFWFPVMLTEQQVLQKQRELGIGSVWLRVSFASSGLLNVIILILSPESYGGNSHLTYR